MKSKNKLNEMMSQWISSDENWQYCKNEMINEYFIDILVDENASCEAEFGNTTLWERFFKPSEITLIKQLDKLQQDFDDSVFSLIFYLQDFITDYLNENWKISFEEYELKKIPITLNSNNKMSCTLKK